MTQANVPSSAQHSFGHNVTGAFKAAVQDFARVVGATGAGAVLGAGSVSGVNLLATALLGITPFGPAAIAAGAIASAGYLGAKTVDQGLYR